MEKDENEIDGGILFRLLQAAIEETFCKAPAEETMLVLRPMKRVLPAVSSHIRSTHRRSAGRKSRGDRRISYTDSNRGSPFMVAGDSHKGDRGQKLRHGAKMLVSILVDHPAADD